MCNGWKEGCCGEPPPSVSSTLTRLPVGISSEFQGLEQSPSSLHGIWRFMIPFVFQYSVIILNTNCFCLKWLISYVSFLFALIPKTYGISQIRFSPAFNLDLPKHTFLTSQAIEMMISSPKVLKRTFWDQVIYVLDSNYLKSDCMTMRKYGIK